MPTFTRWHIKAAMLYLLAALLLGIVLAAQPYLLLPREVAALSPVYFHLFLVGWVTQLIFGVAYWMFPRLSNERPRGSRTLALTTLAALNAGLLLRAVGEPLQAVRPGALGGWLLAASALLQWAAALAFAANIWGRVKER